MDFGPITAYLPTLVVGLIAVILLLVLFVVSRRRLAEARSVAAAAQARAAAAESILASAPFGYYAFGHQNGSARCSLTLAETLGLEDREAAHFDALLRRFRPHEADRLASALERLRQEGRPFSLVVEMAPALAAGGEDGQPGEGFDPGRRFFQVEGARAFAASGGGSTEILWFREVTRSQELLQEAVTERDEFAALLDSLPLPIWARDEELTLIYCNEAYARAVNSDRSRVLSEGIELAGHALAEASRALARRALEEGETCAQAHHVVVGGERRFLELSERPLGRTMLLGMAQDLTGVEEVRGELDRHIDAHAVVLESLGSGIAIFGPDMRLKFFNNAYAQMWQLDESFLTAEPHLGEIADELRERRRLPEQADFRAYKESQVRFFTNLIEPHEELLHIPDGSTLRMTATPHPFGGVLVSYEDVTDRLALERSYNTLIDVQRETLNKLYEAVAVYGADGRLKLYNPAFARIWNLSDEFLEAGPHIRELGEASREFFDIDDSRWPALLERIVAQVTEPDARARRVERADGLVLDVAQVPLPDGNCLFTFLDVSDSIRVERALRERNEALETTDRLKSEFLANVSYELRTPLNAIVGFAEILENQFFGELNERQLEYSRAIVDSSQRLLTLINDILDLATIEAGYLRLDLAPVDIEALLHGIKTLGHERAHSRSIEFLVDCPSDIGSVVADDRRLKQALFNLVSNAFKFTPEGGRVTVSADRDEHEVRLSVSDTGVGIPLDEQSRVFGKFERGNAQGRQSGAGLGLSLVKSLVELHGGWVELNSLPEEGTRVSCHLPLIAIPQPSPGEEEALLTIQPCGPRRPAGLQDFHSDEGIAQSANGPRSGSQGAE